MRVSLFMSAYKCTRRWFMLKCAISGLLLAYTVRLPVCVPVCMYFLSLLFVVIFHVPLFACIFVSFCADLFE